MSLNKTSEVSKDLSYMQVNENFQYLPQIAMISLLFKDRHTLYSELRNVIKKFK